MGSSHPSPACWAASVQCSTTRKMCANTCGPARRSVACDARAGPTKDRASETRLELHSATKRSGGANARESNHGLPGANTVRPHMAAKRLWSKSRHEARKPASQKHNLRRRAAHIRQPPMQIAGNAAEPPAARVGHQSQANALLRRFRPTILKRVRMRPFATHEPHTYIASQKRRGATPPSARTPTTPDLCGDRRYNHKYNNTSKTHPVLGFSSGS